MSRATAQIIITLDPETQEFRAEIPSPNGSRRKVSLPQQSPELWGEIIESSLLELDTWLGSKEISDLERRAETNLKTAPERFNLSLHRKLHDLNTDRYGPNFANKNFGNRVHPEIKIGNIAEMLKQVK